MKSKMMAMFVAGLALVVGAVFVTSPAEAVNATTKRVSTTSVSTTAHYTFILGHDSNVWYTLSSSTGGTTAKTGNAGNAFDLSALNFGTTGFVTTGATFCSSGIVVNSGATLGTCSGHWVKFPGSGSFVDSPQVSLFGPIAASTSTSVIGVGSTARGLFPFLPGSSAMLINILAPGLGGNIWYTLFDGTGNAGSTVSMHGSSGGGLLPATDPFAVTPEVSDSGFVSTSATVGLQFNCENSVSPVRTCSGIWASFP